MHDPMTVAHEIYLGSKKKKNGHYRSPVITIWHVDPETDGTDDSCGWFIEARHLPEGLLDKVIREFKSEWDSTYTSDSGYTYFTGWFNTYGENVLSVRGIVLNMYLYAAKICLNPNDKIAPGKVWDMAWKYINKHYAEIMYFAENNRDSFRDSIVRKFEIGCNEPYTEASREEWIKSCAATVTTDIMRKMRPWYQHPRWHINHWKIQFHPIQNLKRRYWDKCCICGKRGFKGSACSDWDGKKLWHSQCDSRIKPPIPEEAKQLF